MKSRGWILSVSPSPSRCWRRRSEALESRFSKVTATIGGWLLPVANALGLIDSGMAERIVEEGVLEVREKIEVYASSPDDPPAQLISRIPERDRPPRARMTIPPNLQVGHVLPSR